MSKSMKVDDFLSAQGNVEAGLTATLEAVPERDTHVKITPFREGLGCGCSQSFELPKKMIRSVTGTGRHHFCCGKRLEVASVEFTDDAAIPVSELMKAREHAHAHEHGHGHEHHHHAHEHPHGGPPGMPGGGPMMPPGAWEQGTAQRRRHALVGRWPIPWTPCEISCIEVCTRFCNPWGWDCCEWETRCAINCNGWSIG